MWLSVTRGVGLNPETDRESVCQGGGPQKRPAVPSCFFFLVLSYNKSLDNGVLCV